MITGFQHLHSALRWVVLVLMLLAIVRAYSGWKGGKDFAGVKKLALFSMITLHLQLVLGLALYFMKGWAGRWSDPDMMSNKVLRFFTMEHLLIMVIGIAIATVGYSTAKRMDDGAKQNKRIFVFYLIALLLILSRIPWPFMEGFEAYGWF